MLLLSLLVLVLVLVLCYWCYCICFDHLCIMCGAFGYKTKNPPIYLTFQAQVTSLCWVSQSSKEQVNILVGIMSS